MASVSAVLISPERLQLLLDAGALINSRCCGGDDLFNIILQSTLHLLSCEAASLFLPRNSSVGSLECALHLGSNIAQTLGIACWVWQNDQPVIINDAKGEPMLDGAEGSVRNLLSLPVKNGGFFAGVIEGVNKKGGENFTAEDITSLEMLARYAAIAIKNALLFKHHSLPASTSCLLPSECKGSRPFVAKNPAMLSLLENIDSSSASDSPVLIIGENGVGKKMLARQVHIASRRKEKPLVSVNCGEMDPVRLKEELFGIKGAFVSAMGGSVLLDGVGYLPLELQEELLRIMDDKHFRVSSTDQIFPVDVRLIASTQEGLEDLVDHGSFLSSLYVRLNVLPLSVPPLRDRRDEILALAELFMNTFSCVCHKAFEGFSKAAKLALCDYMWPGNVLELENAVQRACILGTPPLIHLNDLRLPNDASEAQRSCEIKNSAQDCSLASDRRLRRALNDFKREYLTRILQQTNWNQTKAARILKVQRTYVSKLITDLGIRR